MRVRWAALPLCVLPFVAGCGLLLDLDQDRDAGAVADAPPMSLDGALADSALADRSGSNVDGGPVVDDAGPPFEFTDVEFRMDGCITNVGPCPADLATGPPAGVSAVYDVHRVVMADRIRVDPNVTVRPDPWQPGAPGSGSLVFVGAEILIDAGALVDGVGRGAGGGGGGGGDVYGDTAYCAGDLVSPGGGEGGRVEGEPGEAPLGAVPVSMADCASAGGRGGGFGGTEGSHGSAGPPGVPGPGGQGAGPFGGLGGGAPPANSLCTDFMGVKRHETDGLPGQPGGYLAIGANGDTGADADDMVSVGSGGGGGSGAQSSTGFCCGGGVGGTGGVTSGGPHVAGCASGGGGAGGGAGGARVLLLGSRITVEGTIATDGAGGAGLGGGYGAGGGVLIHATELIEIVTGALITSLGGAGGAPGTGSYINGGTVKMRAPDYQPPDLSLLSSAIAAGASSIAIR